MSGNAGTRASGWFRALVLCFHGASERWPNQTSVPPEAIVEHVRYLLGRGYAAVTAGEVVSGRKGLLHVTFDDAYRSIVPALEGLGAIGVPSTVFACSRYADAGRPHTEVWPGSEVEHYRDEMRTMDWGQLRAVEALGAEIGSHTVSHPRLTRLDDADLRRELTESRQRIEDEVGRRCAFLAYPFGDQDARVRAAAAAAGYTAAFGLPGSQRSSGSLNLPRVGVYRRDTRARLMLKVSGAGRFFSSIRPDR